MNQFCIVGSLNMDMSTRVDRFPAPGETIQGISFSIFPGGKGANQAVALARLGARVSIVGAIGDDILGTRYSTILSAEGVSLNGLTVVPGSATGTASIEVNAAGENHIIIVPGANGTITPALIRGNESLIGAAGYLLLQLEIPMDAILEAALIAGRNGRTIILDPAPARDLPDELYRRVTILTPNESEAMILSGEDTGTVEGIGRAGKALRAKGVNTVIIKAGKRGAFLFHGETMTEIPGFRVQVVDTVAAGDSFNAGLAFALGRGADLESAVRFANAVGALSTTREGAQSAMPGLPEVEALLGGKT